MVPHSSQVVSSQPSQPASTAGGDIRRPQPQLPHTPFVERYQYDGGVWQSPEPFGSPEANLRTSTAPKAGGPRRPSGYFDYGATEEQATNSSQPLKPSFSNTSARSNSTRVTGINTPGGRHTPYPTVLKNAEGVPMDAHGRRQSVYRESKRCILTKQTTHCSLVLLITS